MIPLFEVRGLSVGFPTRGGLVEAVSGLSFTLERGRVVCLLGESGSGKTVTLRAIVRLNAGARTEEETAGGPRCAGSVAARDPRQPTRTSCRAACGSV